MLLGIDVGTTHCKAGLFDADGRLVRLAMRPSGAQRAPGGHFHFPPEPLWETAATVIAEATAGQAGVDAVGVASMAETGLLVDRRTGQPRSDMVAWFDTGAAPQAGLLAEAAGIEAGFQRSGVYPSFKCSLAKLLWLRETRGARLDGSVWLSAADYIAYRLTGQMGTDYSLAGRTYAFDLATKTWDTAWLERFGLTADVFPPVAPSGRRLGMVHGDGHAATQLPHGTPVCVAGHDHVCAALAGGAVAPGRVFDSMGTAETLIGALAERPLGEAELASGLTYGAHVVPGLLYWMGGLSASGGSIEWLRGILRDPPLSYEDLDALLAHGLDQPGEIIYFPYLTGSGAPHTDPATRGGFVGLRADHKRADLVRAVLEGTAYELEFIRRAAEAVLGQPIRTIQTAGGGTRNQRWLQIKADVSNCHYEALPVADATVLGAALVAGLGEGIFADAAQAASVVAAGRHTRLQPRFDVHQRYARLYEEGYLIFQAPLRQYGQAVLQWNRGAA
jgi:sugar (pentulose or hexulose) kinase